MSDATPKPTADKFIALFENLFALLGEDAFGLIELALLHSGPGKGVLKELFGKSKEALKRADKKVNKAIADRSAKRTHAFRLEDTRPGKMLEALSVYQFFADVYGADNEEGTREANKVWIYLSRKFIQTLSGKVETAVCGADKGRVFRAVELPELVLNSKIKTVNGVAWEKIRDLYFSDPAHGPENAFRLICLSELRLALLHARKEKSKQTIEDYYHRKAYYQIERREALKARGVTPPTAYKKLSRADRRAELKAFKSKITARSGSTRPAKAPVGSPLKFAR